MALRRSGRARLRGDFGRAAAAAALALAIGWGCTLDFDALRPGNDQWTCTATLRSPEGAVAMASSDRDPFASRDICAPAPTMDGEWRRQLFSVVSSDPDLAPLGLSCAELLECVDPIRLPDGMTCPAPSTGPELPDCGTMGTRCLSIEPATTDAGFDARVDFGSVTIGSASAGTLTIANICADDIRLHVAEDLAGRDADHFFVTANDCAPRDDPEERVLGRRLAPAGSPGDSCTIALEYRPAAPAGFHSAQQPLSQDTTEAYRVRLFGTPEAL